MFCLKSHSTDCIIANVMGYLFLLGGKLFLVGNELFYAAPYEARSIATGLSRCPNSEEVSAVAGARANTQLSHGTQVLTSSLASPW